MVSTTGLIVCLAWAKPLEPFDSFLLCSFLQFSSHDHEVSNGVKSARLSGRLVWTRSKFPTVEPSQSSKLYLVSKKRKVDLWKIQGGFAMDTLMLYEFKSSSSGSGSTSLAAWRCLSAFQSFQCWGFLRCQGNRTQSHLWLSIFGKYFLFLASSLCQCKTPGLNSSRLTATSWQIPRRLKL